MNGLRKRSSRNSSSKLANRMIINDILLRI